jgi:hypothetical protein
MSRSPSIVPEDDIYLVLDDFGRLGRAWRETDEAGASRTTLVRNLLEGQYENPVRIVAFNTTEGWSRDVTIDIADELRRRYVEYDDVPASVLKFLETANRHWGHAMSDTILAYFVSLVILASGVFWIVMAAYSAASVVYIAIGVPTVVVGLVSFFTELRET